MQSPQQWKHRTAFNLMQAQTSHDQANRQADTSQRAREDTATHHLSKTSELGASLAQKVNDTNGLIGTLEKRAESLEGSIHRTTQSLKQLEQATTAKDMPLRVCAARLEQRKGRPSRELVRDIAEVALEEERATLLQAQQKLRDAAKKTQAMLSELEGKLEEVKSDIDGKKQALSLDELCLRTADNSYSATLDRTMRTTAPGLTPANVGVLSPGSKKFNVHNATAFHQGTRNELIRQRQVAFMDQNANSREMAAAALWDENAGLLARCQKATDDAAAATNRALRQRADENQQARVQLETELQETTERIQTVMNTIAETRVHMKALEEPMELSSNCAEWRKQRHQREDTYDPVSAKLQDHQEAVQRAHQELAGQQHAEHQALRSLEARREQLQEDLKDKTAAYNIDRGCLTHGPRQTRTEALMGTAALAGEPARAEYTRLAALDSLNHRALGVTRTPPTPRLGRFGPGGNDTMFTPRRSGQPGVLQVTARNLTTGAH